MSDNKIPFLLQKGERWDNTQKDIAGNEAGDTDISIFHTRCGHPRRRDD